MMKEKGAAVMLSLFVIVSVAVVRAATAGEHDLAMLERRQTDSGIAFGPETEFFAAGLHGDGAVFAIIAADPFGTDEGRAIYVPQYRYQRVGYSWAAAGIVFGQENLVLAGLVVVGLLSVGGVIFIAHEQRDILGLRSWWLLVNPALYIGALNDTAEPLVILLLTVAFVSGGVWSSLGLAIVRPSYVVALADRPGRFFAALGTAVLLRIVWSLQFDGSVFTTVGNLGMPFVGFVSKPSLLGLLVLLAGAITFAIGVRIRSWAWMLSGLLVVSLGANVFAVPIHAVRAAGMLPVLWAFYGHDQRPAKESSSAEQNSRISGVGHSEIDPASGNR